MTSCETEISFDMLFDTNYCVLVALSDPGTPVDMVFKIRYEEPDTVQVFDEFNDNPAPSGATYCGDRLYGIFDTDGNPYTNPILYLTESTRTLNVRTTDPAQVGTHTIMFTA
jgi:hypothetical protein